jgi:hypothetical protein
MRVLEFELNGGGGYNQAMEMLALSLQTVLRQPQPAALIALQEALLVEARPSPERDRALELAGHFHRYQIDLQSMLTARQYSELASWLDVTAVGLVAFEELMRGAASNLRDLLIAVASEGAMVLGSRQYIRAWAVEVGPIHEAATWTLREALWRLSEETQPDLGPALRLEAVRRTLPESLSQATNSARAVVLGRLFQTLLLIRVSRLLPGQADGA